MTRLPALLPACLVLAAALAPGAPASAQAYFPLAVGNHWSYASPGGDHEDQTITGTKVVLGRTVFVNTFTNSTANNGLENYWIPAASGGVQLAGWWRALDNHGVVYDPPLLMINGPLALGKTWTTSTSYFTLPGMAPGGPLDLTLTVFAAGIVIVPAGAFEAYGIGQNAPAAVFGDPASPSLALDGTAITGGANGASDWYSDGFGEVQYAGGTGGNYMLTRFDFPTPALAATWGRLKADYR